MTAMALGGFRREHPLAWRAWVAALLALAALIVALGSYYLALSFQREVLPYLQRYRFRAFEGAYAVYSGRVGLLLFTSEVTMTIRVVGLNSTHAALSVTVTVRALGWANTTTAVVRLDAPWVGLTYLHSETEYVEGLGVRECFVFAYGGSGLVYVDAETLWPVRLELELAGASVVLRLKESNVFRPR